MNKLKGKTTETQRRMRKIMLVCSLMLMYAMPAVASATIETSIIVTGTKKLVADVGKALMVLAPVVGGCMEAFEFFKSTHAEDEEMRAIKKKQKVILIGVIGVFVAGAVMTIVASYYKTA